MKEIRHLLSNNNQDLEILLAHAIQKDKVLVLTHPEYKLKLREYLLFTYYSFLYRHGYSIAAITKHKEFFKLNFFVNKNVLIPRPETEVLVEDVLAKLKNFSSSNILLIDVGTGSGCIPIAINKNSDRAKKTIALDISYRALRVARKNVRIHKVNIELLKSNLLGKILNRDFSAFDHIIITANLPYLTADQIKNEPSIQKEPKLALFAPERGLGLYKKLLSQISEVLKNKKLTVYLEIDPLQTFEISEIIKNILPESKIEIKKDLSGRDRIVKITT